MSRKPLSSNMEDEKKITEKLSLATDVLKKNLNEIKKLMSEISAVDEKTHINPPGWLFLKKKTIDQLSALFLKKNTLESFTLLNQAMGIFFNEFTSQKFLLDTSHYSEVVPDIQQKIMTQWKTSQNMFLEGVDSKYLKKYVYKSNELDFIFTVAEIIFYITNKLNFLSYQCTLTYEWCRIKQIKKKYLKQASANLCKISVELELYNSPEDKNPQIEYLKKQVERLEVYFQDLINKKNALIQMMSTTTEIPLTPESAYSRWQSFILEARPKDETSPCLELKESITAQLTGAINLEYKLAAKFDSIQKKSDQFQHGTIKNDLSFQHQSSILSSPSILAISKADSDVDTDLTLLFEKIMQNIPQEGYLRQRPDKEFMKFFLLLKKNILELHDQYKHYATLYEKICPDKFKSSTSREERQNKYSKQYNRLRKRLKDYRESTLPLSEKINLLLQNPFPAILSEEAKISALKVKIREIEERFTADIRGKTSQVEIKSNNPTPSIIEEVKSEIVVIPSTASLNPTIPTIPTQPSPPSRTKSWCCLFSLCCSEDNPSKTPLLADKRDNIGINNSISHFERL